MPVAEVSDENGGKGINNQTGKGLPVLPLQGELVLEKSYEMPRVHSAKVGFFSSP
jgi:hypothetical protein